MEEADIEDGLTETPKNAVALAEPSPERMKWALEKLEEASDE